MNLFAKYYDNFVGADYVSITNFIKSSISKYKPDSELICDLGCGTATIAMSLAKSGYDMIAIDSSEDMLLVANEKIQSDHICNVLLLNQDICNFELYGTVDVIYSTLDTINYITDKRKLNKLFSLVKNYLNYDGLFIFDVNTEYKFKTILGNNTFVYDDDSGFCVWESEYNSKSKSCSHYLTFFEQDEVGKYSRFDEYQYQKFYSANYLKELADKFGFEILELCDNYTGMKTKSATQRVTYVMKINK